MILCGRVGCVAGVGLVLGPQLASRIMGSDGRRARWCYGAAALLSTLHLALAWRSLEETHEATVDGTPPRRLAPLLRLEPLRRRAALFVLHCCVEGKVIQDQVTSVQLTLNWKVRQRLIDVNINRNEYIYIWSSVGGSPDQVWSMDLTPRPPCGGGRGLTYLLVLLLT